MNKSFQSSVQTSTPIHRVPQPVVPNIPITVNQVISLAATVLNASSTMALTTATLKFVLFDDKPTYAAAVFTQPPIMMTTSPIAFIFPTVPSMQFILLQILLKLYHSFWVNVCNQRVF